MIGSTTLTTSGRHETNKEAECIASVDSDENMSQISSLSTKNGGSNVDLHRNPTPLEKHNVINEPYPLISSQSSTKIMEDFCQELEMGRRISEVHSRRTSLLSLATIESHYSQDGKDSVESSKSKTGIC